MKRIGSVLASARVRSHVLCVAAGITLANLCVQVSDLLNIKEMMPFSVPPYVNIPVTIVTVGMFICWARLTASLDDHRYHDT